MRGAKQKEMFEISDLRRRETLSICTPVGFGGGGGGGGGGTWIFSYTHRLGLFFGVKNLEFNIFGGFQKTEYFWGV